MKGDIGIFIGIEHIGSFTPCEIVPELEVRHIHGMEYYYRRGNKYFLRSDGGDKIIFETNEPQDMPKMGTKVNCTFSLKP